MNSIKYLIVLFVLIATVSCGNKEKEVLVFSKTADFRHGSIEPGIAALKKLGAESNFKESLDIRNKIYASNLP